MCNIKPALFKNPKPHFCQNSGPPHPPSGFGHGLNRKISKGETDYATIEGRKIMRVGSESECESYPRGSIMKIVKGREKISYNECGRGRMAEEKYL